MEKNALIWGVFFIFIGLVFFIGNISERGMEELWPVFPLAVGLAFMASFFHDRKQYGLLMPGFILVIVSLLFLYCTIDGWDNMNMLWPVFIMAPGAGFLAMYFGGQKEAGLLIPAGVLFGTGIIFMLISSGLGQYWPATLVVAGLILVGVSRIGRKDKKKDDVKE